jgi:hypothetical protein
VQLAHLAPDAKPGKRQRRIDAARYHEVDVLRQALQEERDHSVDALGIDEVVVVEDHTDLSGEIGQLVDEGTQHRLHPRWLWRAQRGEDAFAEALPYGLPERSNEIGEEPDGIVVSLIQREPGDRPLAVREHP